MPLLFRSARTTEIAYWAKIMHLNQACTLNDILRAAHSMSQFDLSKLNLVILIAMATTVSVPLTTPKCDFTCKFSANEKRIEMRKLLQQTFCTKVSMDIWKTPSTQYRGDIVALRTTCMKNVKFKIIKNRKDCQYVGYLYYNGNLNWA